MKTFLRALGVVVLLLVAALALQFVAGEVGEVVVVTTRDSNGAPVETRLWVVEHEGQRWIRSGGGEVAGWYQLMLANPEVEMQRGDTRYFHLAVPVPEKKQIVNDLMNAKYGWADDYIGLMFGRDDAIAIRLDDRSNGLSD
jgi:hypothetical protein